MLDRPPLTKKVSAQNTKQEVLEAYQGLLRQIEEKRAQELNPEKKLQEKRAEEAVKVAEAVSPDGIDREIGALKADIGKMLASISDRLAAESTKFASIQTAIANKQQELQEVYGIEKAAASLAALIESQNQKRRDFEVELAEQKEELTREIDSRRAEWEKEKKSHEAELRERDAVEKKARDREKEEFLYQFKREQQGIKDKLNDEKTALEREIKLQKETADRELAEREKIILQKETELAQLREKVAAAPKELETAVAKTGKETSDRLKIEAANREELLRKQFEGERNVLAARIEALEKAVKDFGDQNARLSKQLETAYQKVQEIAEKAVESSAQGKSLVEIQKFFAEQARKGGSEKGS